MKTLLVLRGAPGAGKSTWIKNNSLEDYTLCPDELRIKYGPKQTKSGETYKIPRDQSTEVFVWKLLFKLLEDRLSKGVLTVIDATASTVKTLKQYKALADKYGYEMYCIDFTDVPLETCLARNYQRPEYRWVPEDAIKRIYSRFAGQVIPEGIKVIKPNEAGPILAAVDKAGTETKAEQPIEAKTVEEAIQYLRTNSCVREKKLTENISSFNFTREAFYKTNWDAQTILARGLFIDTVNKNIMARSYEKFFRINETEATSLGNLKKTLKFPVKAFVKENGFLAIVSYDYLNDDLFIASKSTNTGDYAGYIRTQLKDYYQNVLNYVRNEYNLGNPVSLVFECEDIVHDPHIIEYNKDRLVLLDIIKNTLKFETLDYNDLVNIATNKLKCPVKELGFIIQDWDEFKDLWTKVNSIDYMYNGRYIEGFVLEDSTGFMTKCKTGFYNQWKKLRGVALRTLLTGQFKRADTLADGLEKTFYAYCQNLYNTERDENTGEYPMPIDIISLRNRFLEGK